MIATGPRSACRLKVAQAIGPHLRPSRHIDEGEIDIAAGQKAIDQRRGDQDNTNARHQGNAGGGTRRFVACSNAYPRRRSVGSLQAMPVKLTPNGAGFALKPSGNAGVGALGTRPNGTITVGYPGFAAIAAPLAPGNRIASNRFDVIASSIPCVPASATSFARSASYRA